jgi:hypothetical protein
MLLVARAIAYVTADYDTLLRQVTQELTHEMPVTFKNSASF